MQSQCGSIILDSYAHSDLARGPNWGLHFDIQIVHTLARTAPTTWFQSTTFWPLDAKLYIYIDSWAVKVRVLDILDMLYASHMLPKVADM